MTNTNKKDMWDLDNIYLSFHVWNQEFENIKIIIEDFSKYKNTIKNNLLLVLNELINIERILSKLYLFAKLNYDLDSLKDENNLLLNKIQSLLDLFSLKTDFVEIEIIKLMDKNLEIQYAKFPELLEYNFLIKKIRNEKKHFLSLKEENILSLSGTILGTNSRIFDKLNDSDCSFGLIDNVELTHGNYHNFITDKDQNIRRRAFVQYHEYYKNHANSISECLITEIKSNIFISNIRKYKEPLDMYLNSDKVSKEVYENLILSVHNNLHLLDEYLQIKKDELKLDELHMYDMFVPLNEDIKLEYTYDQATSIVLESLKPMGEEFYNIAFNGLNNHWVDVYPSKGKASGA